MSPEYRRNSRRRFAARLDRQRGQTAASGFQFVTGGVTNIEDINGIFADGEDDPMLVDPLAPPAVEQLVDFLRELVALGGDRAPQGPGLQGVDGFVEPVQPLRGRGGRDVLAQPSGLPVDIGLGGRGQFDAVLRRRERSARRSGVPA
jgi:hypothetical protein